MEVELLATMFGLNLHVLKVNTQGITHEESLMQPRPSGNCLNWVIGHVAATRDTQIMPLLGEKPSWSPGESGLYLRGSKPMTDPARALGLDRLMRDIDSTQERLIAALTRLTPEALAKSDAQGSLAEKLVMLHFHEAYHMGQVGYLRRLIGKEGAIR